MNIKNKSQQLKDIKAKVVNLDKIYKDLGIITFLFGLSTYHQKFTAGHIMAYVVPALKSSQFKIYYKGIKPIGYVSWAFLSDETEKKYQKGDYVLRMDDFNSGKNLWLTEFVTPYDDKDHKDRNMISEDLKNNIFSDKEAKVLIRNNDGTVKKIFQGKGININNLGE